MTELFKTLSELCEIDGVSGDEGRVRAYIERAVAGYADEVRTDRLGNLAVLKKSRSGSAPRMLAAHMDEIGFIVSSVTEEGYLRVAAVGGFDTRVTLGKRVRVDAESGVIYGVTGVCPVHLSSDDQKKKAPKIEALAIDIGAKSREEALKLVRVGDFVAFATEPAFYGDGRFKAKAIDDRVGCAVMIELLKQRVEPARDTWFLFTTREEIGGAGAKVSSFALAPAEAMVLEGTTAADVAGVSGDKRVCVQGKGVVVSYMDRSAVYAPDTFRRLCKLAEENGIPYQTKMMVAGGTDAGSIHVSRDGIPCSGLAAPVRYIHSPVSSVRLSDCEAMYALAARCVSAE